MGIYKLTETEIRLSDILWDKVPIGTGELVALCEDEFKWKKSTTYTMLKRLSQKEIFINRDSIIYSLITKNDFYSKQSELYVVETFSGSLPKFIAAFTRGKKLSDNEIEEIEKLINNHKEG